MFGDASGAGFGSSLLIKNKLFYLHGKWNSEFSQETSNYRELANLLHAIQSAADSGLLTNVELFMFTVSDIPTLKLFKSFTQTLRNADPSIIFLPFQASKQDYSSISTLKQINLIDE